MTDKNTRSNDDTTKNECGKHRGFSQKVRGVLLESQSAKTEKLPTVTNKNVQNDVQTAATAVATAPPHRGFNDKAREVLLDQKTPGTTSSKVKGSEKIRQLI